MVSQERVWSAVAPRSAGAKAHFARCAAEFSAVCGTGLDTIPLPGDTSAEQLSLIISDMATLAVKWHKPLSAKLLPVTGKGWGETTDFDDTFLVNATIQQLDKK